MMKLSMNACAVALFIKIRLQRHTIVVRFDELGCLAPEPQGIEQHTVERWTKEIFSLGKQAVQGAGTEIETGLVTLNAETHIGRLPGNPQFFHQRDKIGVGIFVKNDKARIHSIGSALHGHIDGAGMPANVVIGFVDNDVM